MATTKYAETRRDIYKYIHNRVAVLKSCKSRPEILETVTKEVVNKFPVWVELYKADNEMIYNAVFFLIEGIVFEFENVIEVH